MKRGLVIATASMALLGSIPGAQAEDLGTKAQTYRPDPDAREQIKSVVRAKQQSGELDAFWKAYRDKTVAAIKNPSPLGVRTDYSTRTEVKPVRFVIPMDYRDHNGKVMVQRGTAIEPLQKQALASGLIFIDGRDPAQVSYAIARGRRVPLKIVLTAGSPYELRVKYQKVAWRGGTGVPFYFDQRRMILDTLKRLYGIDIASVPAVMTQSGTGVKLEFGMGSRS